jgi:hypothetical protein
MSGAGPGELRPFAWPVATLYGRPVPKNQIYARAKPSKRLRQRFIDVIADMRWSHTLAPRTLRLPAAGGVEEVQVFAITLKGPPDEKSPEDVLRCIDRAVPSPIVFELLAGDRVRTIAAYKRPSEADAAKVVLGGYYASPWVPAEGERSPLPVAVDMAALYAALLRRLMPLPPRSGEGLREHAERLETIEKKRREADRLESATARESQFNRKVELNAQARAAKAELDALLAESPTASEPRS